MSTTPSVIGSLSTHDGLTVTSSTLIKGASDGSAEFAICSVEGTLRYINLPFNQKYASTSSYYSLFLTCFRMDIEDNSSNSLFITDIYKGNYPILDVDSLVSSKGYTLISSVGLDSMVRLYIRSMIFEAING